MYLHHISVRISILAPLRPTFLPALSRSYVITLLVKKNGVDIEAAFIFSLARAIKLAQQFIPGAVHLIRVVAV